MRGAVDTGRSISLELSRLRIPQDLSPLRQLRLLIKPHDVAVEAHVARIAEDEAGIIYQEMDHLHLSLSRKPRNLDWRRRATKRRCSYMSQYAALNEYLRKRMS